MERIPLSVFEKFNNQELLLDVPEDRFISKSLQSQKYFRLHAKSARTLRSQITTTS